MKRSSPGLFLSLATVILAAPILGHADGNVVRARMTNDTLALTLLAPPEISQAAITELSLLIQREPNGELVRDADVDLTFIPPPGVALEPDDPLCTQPAGGASSGSLGLARTRRSGSGPYLTYTAPIRFSAAGTWQMRATIRQPGNTTSFQLEVPVTSASSNIASLWPGLALPPIAIALFALNQRLRRRRASELLIAPRPITSYNHGT
jgi:hypothetical protein